MRTTRSPFAGLVLAVGAGGLALLLARERRATAVAAPPALVAQAAMPSGAPERQTSRSSRAEERRRLESEAAAPALESHPEDRAQAERADERIVTLVGRVEDERGEPIAGAELVTHDGVLRARSDVAGRLVTLEEEHAPWPANLFGSKALLRVHAAGHASRSLQVRARAGATLLLGTLVLGPGADVFGVVHDEAGEPVAHAQVSLSTIASFPQDEAAARAGGIDVQGPFDVPATTDAEGCFRLQGAPPGEWFVVGGAEGKWLGWTRPFSLRAGEDASLDLVLLSDGSTRVRWTIRVLDPRGETVAGAKVRIRAKERGSYSPLHQESQEEADDAGRVVLQVQAGEELEVSAFDPEERWRSSPEERRSSSADLAFDLVLREPAFLALVVTDQQQRPIPSSTVRVRTRQPPRASWPTAPDGRLRILLPDGPFSLEASAPGFAEGSFGPYDPAGLSGEQPLLLQLSPGRAVGGRVLAAGVPVAEAEIALCRKGAPDDLWASSEITSEETPFLLTTLVHGGRATTDDAGLFVINVRYDGWYTAVVEAEGFPPQAFGPFELRGAASLGHDLALAHGGSIEGRIVLPPGASASELLAGASSGSGVVLTSPVDEDGRFRIGDLAPGGYQVRACRPPAAHVHWLTRPEQAGTTDFVADCTVREGATTAFDLDLSLQGSVVLHGSFQVPDWTMDLVCLTRAGETRACASSDRNVDRGFQLTVSRPGPCWVELRGSDPYFGMTGVFRAPIELAVGEQEFRPEPAWGRVEVVSGRGIAGSRSAPDLVLAWRRDDGTSYEVDLRPLLLSGQQRCTLPFPAGEVELLRVEESARELVRALEVRTGETVVLDVSP